MSGQPASSPPFPSVEELRENRYGIFTGDAGIGPHEGHLLSLVAIFHARSGDDVAKHRRGAFRSHGGNRVHGCHPDVPARVGQRLGQRLGAHCRSKDCQRFNGRLPRYLLLSAGQLNKVRLRLPQPETAYDSGGFGREHGILGGQKVHHVTRIRADEAVQCLGETIPRPPVRHRRNRSHEGRDGLGLQGSDERGKLLRGRRFTFYVHCADHLGHGLAHVSQERRDEILRLVLPRLVCQQLQLVDDQRDVSEVSRDEQTREKLAKNVHYLSAPLLVSHFKLVQEGERNVVYYGASPLGFHFALQVQQIGLAESDVRELRRVFLGDRARFQNGLDLRHVFQALAGPRVTVGLWQLCVCGLVLGKVDVVHAHRLEVTMPQGGQQIVVVSLPRLRENIHELGQLALFHSGKQSQLSDTVLEEAKREVVRPEGLGIHLSLVPQQASLVHREREMRELVPHRAEPLAELAVKPLDQRVARHVRLPGAHGLQKRVDGLLDQAGQLFVIRPGHRIRRRIRVGSQVGIRVSHGSSASSTGSRAAVSRLRWGNHRASGRPAR